MNTGNIKLQFYRY